MCIITELLCCTSETSITLYVNHFPIKNFLKNKENEETLNLGTLPAFREISWSSYTYFQPNFTYCTGRKVITKIRWFVFPPIISVFLLVIICEDDVLVFLAISSRSHLCGQMVNKTNIFGWRVKSERGYVLNLQCFLSPTKLSWCWRKAPPRSCA